MLEEFLSIVYVNSFLHFTMASVTSVKNQHALLIICLDGDLHQSVFRIAPHKVCDRRVFLVGVKRNVIVITGETSIFRLSMTAGAISTVIPIFISSKYIVSPQDKQREVQAVCLHLSLFI